MAELDLSSLTPEQLQQIAAMTAKKVDVVVEKETRKVNRFTNEQKAQAEDLAKNGATKEEIIKLSGVSESMAKKYVEEAKRVKKNDPIFQMKDNAQKAYKAATDRIAEIENILANGLLEKELEELKVQQEYFKKLIG